MVKRDKEFIDLMNVVSKDLKRMEQQEQTKKQDKQRQIKNYRKK